MSDKSDWIEVATKIFEGTKWDASDEDISQLSQRLCEINNRGLSKLNRRLIEGGRKVWDTFAELNFCYELIENNLTSAIILYEPDEINGKTLQRPPDFVLQKEGVTIWIQMKSLSMTERENRQSKIIAQIKKLAQSIKLNMFFWCSLSEDFSNADIKPFVEFMSSIADNSKERKEYLYRPSGEIKAKVSFWKPKKAIFENLTLGGAGDLGCVEVTGESSAQIKGSLINAAGAFTWDVDGTNINLIAMETGSPSHGYIDIGEALFGTEEVAYGANEGQRWRRLNDGFFNNVEFCNKVAGVIVMRIKEQ